MTQGKTCADFLVNLLEMYGVDLVFGIPGVHTLDLYRSLGNSSIRHVSVRHEQGAGFAADGYARITGKPGVCFLISGPGVTNAATPIGQAYADSVPLLIISSDNPADTLGRGYGLLHEVSDLAAMTRPITALSAVVYRPEALPDLIAQAFDIFESGRPRPVHLVLPLDVLARPAAIGFERRAAQSVPTIDPSKIDEAAAILRHASRPLFIVGGGARGCGEPIATLAEKLAAPVLATNAGKGILPEGHPLSLGSMISRPAVRRAIAAADVVVVAGSEVAETDSYTPVLPITGVIIRIDIDEGQFEGAYPTTVAIHGDAQDALTLLNKAIGKSMKGSGAHPLLDSRAAEIADFKAQAISELSDRERVHLAAIEAIQSGLPDDLIAVGDMCQLVYTATAFWRVQSGRWFYAAGFCTLGCALPMAIGAGLGAPGQPVAVLVGDAGFQFTLNELATAVEAGLAFPIIVWNNAGLGAIVGHMHRRSISPMAVDYHIGNPDLLQLAGAYGCHGSRPNALVELTAAVNESLSRDRPTIIDCREEMVWRETGFDQ